MGQVEGDKKPRVEFLFILGDSFDQLSLLRHSWSFCELSGRKRDFQVVVEDLMEFMK